LEYLGLHNKPKAEVHPGHKMTGPNEYKEEEEEEEEEEDPLKWIKLSIVRL
jgi:TPP-dependent pyruvate/acetoin dehydrogenase alpha subunit